MTRSIELPSYLVAETFGVVSYLFQVVKVLRLAGPESFATDRTMDRDDRSVAQGTARLRVVEGRHAIPHYQHPGEARRKNHIA